MKSITINDIANALGLSRNTVSKVLNGKEVPEKTRRLVLEKANELNYKQMAGTKLHKNKILLLSGKPLSNFNFYVPILRYLENECYKKGDQLFQYVCRGDENAALFLKDNVESMAFDGIICIEFFDPALVETVRAFDLPTVFLDSPADGFLKGNIDIVLQDNYTPLEMELKRLIEHGGVRSIGFVGDHNHCLSFRERYEAVLISSGLHNLPHSQEMDFLFPDGHQVYYNRYLMTREISKRPICDCYVCANDFIARHFTNALALSGKKVPQDTKIIGFDNTIDANGFSPKITSVTVEPMDIAEILINTIRSRISHPTRQSLLFVVHSELDEKESTRIEKVP